MLSLQMQEEGDDLCLYGYVECRGRLIADEDFGMNRHRARNRRPLALAAAHLVRIAICVCGGQSDLGEEFGDAPFGVAFIRRTQAADGLANHRADGAARVERAGGVLKHHLDAGVEGAAFLSACVRDVLAVEENAPARRQMQPREELCNGGFAAAALADDAEEFAPREGQGYVVDCLNASRRIVKVHGDIFKAQECALITTYVFFFRDCGGGFGDVHMLHAIAVRMCRRIHFRYCCNQALCVWMLRISEHLQGIALLDDLSFAHDGDAVGDVPYDADVVRDEEDCRTCALLERAQLVQYLQLDRRVECRGRLIGEEELRAQDNGECDGCTLCHAARQFERIGREDTVRIGKPHAAEYLCRACVDFLTRQIGVCTHRLNELRANPPRRVQRCTRVLKHHRDLLAAQPAPLSLGEYG